MSLDQDPAAAAPSTTVPEAPRLGLVLPGGGARSAYQVGVLKAVAELLPRRATNPFPIITGTSAGAILATLLASHAQHFAVGVRNIEHFWANFRIDQVFRADVVSMLRSGAHWLLALLTGGLLVPPPRSLFDNSPLRALLERHVNFARARQALATGSLDALAITASGYASARSIAFYECARPTDPWADVWRQGRPAELSLDHLMASAAVPFLFPPVFMEGEYFGDGAMRQVSPLSPAVHLGADRLLVIAVRDDTRRHLPPPVGHLRAAPPTIGQIFGFMLDTLFMDGLHADIEGLQRMNQLLAGDSARTISGLRRIESLLIVPSQDLGAIAGRHAAEMPRTLRALLRTMGALNPGGRQLISYLLFQSGYTRELIALGYADAMARRNDLLKFFGEEICPPSP